MSSYFVLPAERRPQEWSARHLRGEVPGRWPYGLEAMNTPPGSVRVATIDRPSRLARALRFRRTAARSGTGFTWDENTAQRMVRYQPYERMFSGVIWATDRPAPPAITEALARMDGVWVLSSAQVDDLARLVPASIPRHHVLFGVDTDFFHPTAYPEQPLIFSVGGDRDRDPETTAAAFSAVLDARPTVRALLQTPRQITVDQRIQVVRHLTHQELRETYQQASVVVVATNPNRHVSGMTVSLEAMASGRPVVATRTPGFEDYLHDGDTGVFTRVGDVDELADRIIALIDDPGLAARIGAQGASEVSARMSTNHLAQRLATIVQPPGAPR